KCPQRRQSTKNIARQVSAGRPGPVVSRRSHKRNRRRGEAGYLSHHREAGVKRQGSDLRQLRASGTVAMLRSHYGDARGPHHRRSRRRRSHPGKDHGCGGRRGSLRLTAPRRFHNLQSLAGLGGILILAVVLSPTAADGSRIFLQLGNLTDILRQISVIGIIALAMTFVILTAGIDLSVGSILALSTSVVAMMLTRTHHELG